jgi:hypothetical protein
MNRVDSVPLIALQNSSHRGRLADYWPYELLECAKAVASNRLNIVQPQFARFAVRLVPEDVLSCSICHSIHDQNLPEYTRRSYNILIGNRQS